jgi:hypothetical protein
VMMEAGAVEKLAEQEYWEGSCRELAKGHRGVSKASCFGGWIWWRTDLVRKADLVWLIGFGLSSQRV